MPDERSVTTPSDSTVTRPDRPVSRAAAGRLGSLMNVRLSGPILFLAILIVAFGATTTRFLLLSNIRSVLFTAAILVIAGLAQGGVVITRNLDLSIGALMAAGAYFPLLLTSSHPGVGPLVIPVAIVIGAMLGIVNGLVVAYLRIPSLIATLGTLSVFRGLIYASANGRELDTHIFPAWLLRFIAFHPGGVPILAVVAAAAVGVVALVLRRTQFGRTVYAVGSNPGASVFYGLRARPVIVGVYVMSGALAGLAGILLAGTVGTVTVDIATGFELQTLAAAVIGGASLLGGSGSALGVALGALIIATLNNGLVQLGASGYWQGFVQGSAIVIAVAFDVMLQKRTARRLAMVARARPSAAR